MKNQHKMEINIIRILFVISAILTGSLGLLLNCMEPYLPSIITRTYRYGKFSANVHQPIVARAEVPKRWFKHFYLFAAPASSYVLYLVVCKYFYKKTVPQSVTWVLNVCLGSSRQPQVSSESTFLAAALLTLHCWKRFYETQCISIFSDKMMNISHYLIGFYHYIGTLLSVIGESKGFVEGSEASFSWAKITYLQILCAIICVLSSYTQFKANLVLHNLRKEKDGKLNTAVYRIPHGGLFEYVSGALQLTEIIIYVMLSTILWQSSTYHYVTIWVLVNQVSTGVLTHKWYRQTFHNYPKTRKALIPYIF